MIGSSSGFLPLFWLRILSWCWVGSCSTLHLAILMHTNGYKCLICTFVITFANTIGRYAFNAGMTWAPEASLICMAMMTFPGAAAFYRRGAGMAYTALVDRLDGQGRDLVHAIALWTVIGISGVSLAVYPRFFSAQLTHTLAVLDISNGFVAIWLGIGLVLMLVYTVEKMVQLRASSAAMVHSFTG